MGITATERNNSLATVNNARKKWGLETTGSNTTAGTTVQATADVNNLITWLTEAKNKCGSPQTIMAKINAGTIITNVFPTLNSQANNIYNYCKCHGNCSGSCTGSCTGTCRNNCEDDCMARCSNNCIGKGST